MDNQLTSEYVEKYYVKKPICKHCNEPFISMHKKQIFCTEKCRIEYWESKSGRKFFKGTKK
jgi:hypothetical protein